MARTVLLVLTMPEEFVASNYLGKVNETLHILRDTSLPTFLIQNHYLSYLSSSECHLSLAARIPKPSSNITLQVACPQLSSVDYLQSQTRCRNLSLRWPNRRLVVSDHNRLATIDSIERTCRTAFRTDRSYAKRVCWRKKQNVLAIQKDKIRKAEL